MKRAAYGSGDTTHVHRDFCFCIVVAFREDDSSVALEQGGSVLYFRVTSTSGNAR